MFKTIGTRRSRRGASVWMFDPLHPVLMLAILMPLLGVGLVDHGAARWWWWGLAALPFVPTLARLRLARDSPGLLRVTKTWLLIPYEVHHVALTDVTSDFAVPESDRHDLLKADRWEFECRDAADLLASLRAASADLATPEARTPRRTPR